MLHQSPFADGRKTAPIPGSAGMVATAVFEHTLTAAYATATDFIEIGSIPATARPLSATIIGEGFTAGTTATVAAMDGVAGEADDARALTGPELFTAQDVVDAEAETTAVKCLALGTQVDHRGLGVKLSADEAASANKKLTVILSYTY